LRYLLDTNVISEALAKMPEPRVIEWMAAQDPFDLFLSSVTVGEIQRGIERMPDLHKRTRMRAWLIDEVLVEFEGRVLTVDLETMLEWGVLAASLDRMGRQLPFMDSLIAAQTIRYRCTLVTRNVRDFGRTGIAIVNPWEI
jgi:toxin FitB